MNKYFKLLLVIFIFLISFNVSAKEKVKLYFFHGAECPHCAEEKSDLLKDLKKDKDVEIIEYEVWHNEENAKLVRILLIDSENNDFGFFIITKSFFLLPI